MASALPIGVTATGPLASPDPAPRGNHHLDIGSCVRRTVYRQDHSIDVQRQVVCMIVLHGSLVGVSARDDRSDLLASLA
jgi:hypothetical protein